MEYLQISVTGIIQGVGFRPFIYRKACELGLKGSVCNTNLGVTINLSGEPEKLDQFINAVKGEAPPAAVIDSITVQRISPFENDRFEISKSTVSGDREVLISPDLGTCEECVKELFDPADRRYRYPFINCTNCGPRFTIIENTPYDRRSTSMSSFTMCDQCREEYEDPMNRRFHAQPNACPRCGPRLLLVNREGEKLPGEPVDVVSEMLKRGEIVAVKGLGGFHLACDATSDEAVRELRRRKNRYGKPLAVMVRDSARARDYCEISPMEHSLMSSPKRPIVLLEEKEESPISRHVAEGLKHQGLFLPYTPLHYLLLEQCGLPLVMTSGNISGEPIAIDNEEALERLSGVAGCFLLHDRDILIRYDDSVTRVFQGVEYPVRRARGYAPYPLTLSSSSEIEVLALGAELKNTFCLLRADKAYVGQHVGNMDNALALDHFEKALETVTRLFSLKPQLVACDLHPEYVTTQIAADYGIPVTPVQHHHAHIAGCMADNCLEEEVIGVAWDGTGYGEDGTVWGGEFLYCNGPQYRRLAHLRQYKMPGSDSCIYSIYRMAAGVLSGVYSDADTALGKLRQVVEIEGAEADIIAFQLENGVNALLTSSSGRLFDAAASITGMRRTAQYDGQAACELEAVAEDVDSGYPFQLLDGQGIYIVDTGPLFEGLLTDSLAGVQRSLMAGKFHHTMACIIAETCDLLSGETGIRKIALSGGVFQNVLLTGKVVEMLKSRNLVPVLHRRVPCNDGGIAFGQAVVAAGRFAQSTSKVDSEDNSEGGFIEKDKSRGSVGDGALSI